MKFIPFTNDTGGYILMEKVMKREMTFNAHIKIDNGSVQFERVQTEPFKIFETWTEPNHKTIKPKLFRLNR